MTVSAWADAYRYLSSESSAEPGKYYTSRAPYQREPMDMLTQSNVSTVVLMWSSQVGKTELLNNVAGYFIDQDPSPIMVVQQTEDMAKAWSKDRLSPMVRDTPRLRDKINVTRKRDGGNNILHKSFPGGHITMVGANSTAGLASRPIRVLLMDEVDRWPESIAKDGDPMGQARKRTETFFNKKELIISTPTVEGSSRIAELYDISDRRRFYVPCPTCGHMQTLRWENLKWDKNAAGEDDPDTAHMVCEASACIIKHNDKVRMLSAGKWVAEFPQRKVKGYHLNVLYSPWSDFTKVVTEFLEKRKLPETLQTFINTSLAEVWKKSDIGESIDDHWLASRAEDFGEYLPDGVLLLTAGVDVQADRLEVEIVGWGVDEESWSLAYVTLYGNPARMDVWDALDDVLGCQYAFASGKKLDIACACVDSGGSNTEDVYQYAKRKARQKRRIFAIKGQSQAGKPVAGRPTQNNSHRVKLFPLGVDTAKAAIFSRLKIEQPGPGYCHFPIDREEEYYKQLTAEKLVQKKNKGRLMNVWEKVRPRNEALDCRVYALAALKILNPNWDAISKRFAAQASKRASPLPAPPVDNVQQEPPAPPPVSSKPSRTAKPRRKGGGFVNGWR